MIDRRMAPLALAVVAAVTTARPVSAQPTAPAVELVASSPAAATDPGQEGLRTKDRIARAQITLKNPGTAPLDVRPETNWRHLGSGSLHAAQWMAPQTGAQPDAKGAFKLEGGKTDTFMVEGQFDRPGTYVTGVSVAAGDGPARRFSIAVTRTIAAVPADLLAAPKPARIDVPFARRATASTSVMRLPAHNSGMEPIPLGTPAVLRFSVLDGEAETPVAVPVLPSVQASGCPAELLPKQDCAVEVTIPAGLRAGRYAVEIAMAGLGGGRSTANVRIDVRLSALYAGLLVMAGALAGYFVVLWRERGRTILDRRVALAEAGERISKFADNAMAEVVRQRAKGLLDMARTLEDTIATGGDPSAGIATLRERGQALASADEVLARAAGVKPPDLFVSLVEKLTTDLQTERWTVDAVNATVQRLNAEFDVLPNLLRAAEETNGALRALAALDGWPPAASMRPIRQDLANAFTPIAVGEGTETEPALRKRATALKMTVDRVEVAAKEASTALLTAVEEAVKAQPTNAPLKALETRLQEALQAAGVAVATAKQFVDEARSLNIVRPALVREVTAAESQIPTISTPLGGLDINPFTWGIGLMIPSGWLRFTRAAWSLLTDVVVLIGIGLSGILVLWGGNSAWGTVTDIVTAALAGAGTRLAVGQVTRS